MTNPVSTFSGSLPEIPGYTVVEQLYLSSRTVVYRAVQRSQQRPVVIKVLRREHPSCDELVPFRHQYTIAKNLPITGIVHPLGLEPMGSSYALVMEDYGGISLEKYVQHQAMDLAEVLAIALQIADILHALCQHRVVHKDIKPANILIHPESKQIKLIDFSLASLLPKETQEIQSPHILEGTLAYLAPEQTGRMNRSIDYRADFYALGVTLYQLLTGALPFASDDPLELVHCHLAKVPVPIDRVKMGIPVMMSAIVAKLMAKNAEDRYQSAIGLKRDLAQCLTQWKETGEISEFELGEKDLSDRFLIPEKLYGRAAEVQSLLRAFARVVSGSSELILIAGFSGMGKTAVVNEVHKPIMRQRGYFIKGKFDQFNRNMPLSAFVQGLRDLMGQLLSESDIHLAQWRAEILSAVGENGQVLIDVIPELEQIIGKQPRVAVLGSGAQNRFNLLFQKFIAVFATAEHPLVVFLDDLQWADSASLRLIELLMNNGHLLVLGAYRDNEVSSAHPLILTVEELKTAKTIVHTIILTPLAFEDTNHLIADTLHCSRELAQPLTELIDRKTKGNPFFTTQFLKALHEDGQISFDRERRCWKCDIAQVNALSLTDDVVEFISWQLQKLPPDTQLVIQLAACIGNQFDLATLALISERSPTNAAMALWKALQEGLILPTSQVYKFFQSEEPEPGNTQNTVNLKYQFLHDRVQQAAYTLIPADRRVTIHRRIGQLLLSHFSSTTREERIFEIVCHLNPGSSLIVDPAERIELAQLNLMAGRKAMSSTAYGAALEYLNQGIGLLPDDAWNHHYDLTLELHHNRLDVAYLNTRFEELKAWGELVLQQATSVLDRIKVYETRMMALRAQGRFLEVMETGLQVLKLMGIEFPPQPTPADIATAYERSRQAWQGRDPLSLLALPAMQDPQILAAMQILTKLVPSVHIAAPSLLPLLSFKQVELSIQHGNSPISIFSYADYGLILCGIIGDIPTGYKFGQLSLALLEQLQLTSFKSRAYFIVNSFTRHWQEPLRHSIPLLLEGYRSGLESGDWECVALNLLTYSHYQYWAGQELKGLAEDMVTYRQVIDQVKQEATLRSHEAYLQAVLNLLGQVEVPYRLQGTVFDSDRALPHLQVANDRVGLFHVYLNQALLSYWFEQDESAAQLSAFLEEYSDAACGFFLTPIWIFYDALIQLRRYSEVLPEQQALILDRVAAHQERLHDLATHAPFNHQHRWQLVAAEQFRVLNQKAEAIEHYDSAIASAKVNGYLQEEALANELATKFYLDWGKEKVAAAYMQEAYYCYDRWGAKAKTDDLKLRYPNLLHPILQQAAQPLNLLESLAVTATPNLSINALTGQNYASSTSVNATLDFAAILKAAQSLSGTIHLDVLIHQLTQIILQHSGGDRCALILPDRAGEWRTAAIATLETLELRSEPLDGNDSLPVKLIQYVKHTQKAVMIDNLKTDLPVIDEYLTQRQPKSLLCLPILNQGHLIGILYLKNCSTSGAFTSDRILILNFLCSQAAISLENARLYQQSQTAFQELQQSQQLLRSIIDTIPQVVFWKDRSSAYLGCNQKFATTAGLTSPEAIVGKTDYDLPCSKEEADSYRAYDREIMESNQAELHIVETQQQMDGSTIWIDTSKIPLCNEVGEVYGILGSYEDISDRQKREATIMQKSQDLERALQDLQNAQTRVVQSEKMSALGNLVAGIAHEINNPIGFLNGSINNTKDYVRDLLDYIALYRQHHPNVAAPVQDKAEDIDFEFLSEDLPKLLDSMKGATERIKSISTSLRTFSRADTESKVSADLHEGIDSTLLILKYRLKANERRPEIEVIKDYGEVPLIECFPGQLNQVFMNILANAIDVFDEAAQHSCFANLKAHPQTITIQTTILTAPNGVEIRIRDNGKGMTEGVKARIFDHLFTTKGVGKGTGLGLAIAHQIVTEKHCGSLEVQSELGQGTEFCIGLPISGRQTFMS